MNFNDREKIISLTPLWKGERLPDGRPKVEDKYLDALYGMTLEEVWKPIFVLGYEHQFVGGGLAPLTPLHDDGRKLVGRAVTCTYCPSRPDLHNVQFSRGAEDGLQGNYNQWVIDRLYERDVVVCDMYDKIYKGTFLGGNLTTALQKHTKTADTLYQRLIIYIHLIFIYQNKPLIFPSVSTSMLYAAGCFERPGIVIISPVNATIKPAPAESLTSRTVIVKFSGLPSFV